MVASHVNRVANGSAPVSAKARTTISAMPDCSSEPPIGAPARVPPPPTRLSADGSTPSRLSPNTYRPIALWKDSIDANIEVRNSSNEMKYSALP